MNKPYNNELYLVSGSCAEEVPFTVYPGGERIPNLVLCPEIEEAAVTHQEIQVFKSICAPQDLFDVLQVKEVLDSLDYGAGGGVISLVSPYIFGARQDRRPTPIEGFTAKVVADIINLAGFQSVVTYQPHSDVLPALLRGYEYHPTKEDNLSRQLLDAIEQVGALSPDARHVFVAPDAGASKRVGAAAKGVLRSEPNLSIDVIQAGKTRNVVTGRLSGFTCPPIPEDATHIWVVDDVCANGGTFRGLADKIIETAPARAQLYLTVAHADKLSALCGLVSHGPFDHAFVSDSRPHGDEASGVTIQPLFRSLLPSLV